MLECKKTKERENKIEKTFYNYRSIVNYIYIIINL